MLDHKKEGWDQGALEVVSLDKPAIPMGIDVNRMAYEYLMCHTLLNRDVEKFMRYYPLGQHAGYSRIPRSFQEVLVGVWLQRHGNLRSMPYSVDAKTADQTVELMRLLTSGADRHQLNLPPYCHNAWHYITKTSEE